MSLPEPRAILFDWDNTLVDTWPIIHAALEKTFAEFGLEPWSLDMVKARVRKSMRDSFPEIFGESWQKAGERYQQHYRDSHLIKLEELPGAEDFLRAMATRQVPMGVVSNKKGINLRKEVTQLGWDQYFTAIVGADDAARDKPFPDPVHLALESLKLEAGPDIWFIGDSEVDLDCAGQVGCTPILFGDYAPAHPDFTATHYQGFAYAAHALDHAALHALFSY